MIGDHAVLAVVPARSGSKGIPDKNIRVVGGKTLIQRTGETLAAVELVDLAVISTDSSRYAEHAEQHGLRAPFLRPAELATDDAGSLETVQHALHAAEDFANRRFEIVLLVPPTTPTRRPSEVAAAAEKLVRTGADSVVTVSAADTKYSPKKLLVIEDDHLGFYHPEGPSVTARQQLGGYYWRNGICYAIWREKLLGGEGFITSESVPLIIDRPVVNIDYPIELEWAEFLLEREGGDPMNPEG